MVVDYSEVKWNCPICKEPLDYAGYTAFVCHKCQKGFTIHQHHGKNLEGLDDRLDRIEKILSYLLSEKMYEGYISLPAFPSNPRPALSNWDIYRKEKLSYILNQTDKPIWLL